MLQTQEIAHLYITWTNVSDAQQDSNKQAKFFFTNYYSRVGHFWIHSFDFYGGVQETLER